MRKMLAAVLLLVVHQCQCQYQCAACVGCASIVSYWYQYCAREENNTDTKEERNNSYHLSFLFAYLLVIPPVVVLCVACIVTVCYSCQLVGRGEKNSTHNSEKP